MGAGVSQKVVNGHYYRRLKKLQRELEAAGVPSQYGRWQLLSTTGDWRISFNTLRASNGETCGMMHIAIGNPQENYGKNWDAEKGIARIKQLFGRTQCPSTTQEQRAKLPA